MMSDSHQSSQSTSLSMLAGAQAADPLAWEKLTKLYAPLVAHWCRRFGIPEQEIGDLIQEVFSAVARNVQQFRKEKLHDTFRGWLAVITRNKVRDYHRRCGREPAATGGSEAARQFLEFPELADELETSGGSDAAFGDLLRRALLIIQAEFHERTWQAFWKIVVEGRVPADVAIELQMSPGAVRVAKSRVLLRLRQELGDAQH